MWKKLTAAGLAIGLTISGYFAVPQSVWAQGTVQIGVLMHGLASLSLPFQTTDTVVVERSSIGFKTPTGGFLQTANNLSDIATTSNGAGGTLKTTARNNIGGATTTYVSIDDFANVDPTGVVSSDAAFVSCITSGKDCRIPAGTYLISCTNHNATLPSSTAPITIFGDDWHTSNLKVASGCTGSPALPTAGIISLANVKDLSINVNNAVATAQAPIISSFNGTSAINTPNYTNVHMSNVGATTGATNANILGIRVGSTSTTNVTSPIISKNFFNTAGASSTTVNQCIQVTQTAGSVTAGIIEGNTCIGSAIDVSAFAMEIRDNDISSFAYRAGIFTEIATNSNTYIITNNRIRGGGPVVVNGSPTDGIANNGGRSMISNNTCNTLGGVCVVNGGQASSIIGNNSFGTGHRNDGLGGAAYFSLFTDAVNNGNNSIWSDNVGRDDGQCAPACTIEGLADNPGSAGLLLTNNFFPGLTPYTLSD